MSKEKTIEKKIKTNFKFEETIIDPILNCIKDNQEYLTKKENLPQLAKLGFMYNSLWYAGRVCWGYSGELWKKYEKFADPALIEEYGEEHKDDEEVLYSACEDNPKYKIEMCDPENDEIENYIYDAWGMHVTNDNGISFEDFRRTVIEGRKLTELDIKMLKQNKTFDEWVEVLTDKNYKYSYTNRKSVANHLLCVIGNGYGFSKDGFVFNEASGADQDTAGYGDWENVKFREDIQTMVNTIISNPFVKETIEAEYAYVQAYKKIEQDKEDMSNEGFYEMLEKAGTYKKSEGRLDWKELHKRIDDYFESEGISTLRSKKNEYYPYYPICNYSVIHTICDPESRKRNGILSVDQSYIDASIEICKEILEHEKEESKDNRDNVEYAKKFLFNLGFDEYGKDLPKEIDKYRIEKEVNEILKTLNLTEVKDNFNVNQFKGTGYHVDFRNTATSDYGDNNFYIKVMYENSEDFPNTINNSVSILKNTKYYTDFKNVMDSLSNIEDVGLVNFYFSNTSYKFGKVVIEIEVITEGDRLKYSKECVENQKQFTDQGFILDKSTLSLKVGDYRLVTQKPEPLGSTHPNNIEGDRYYSKSKYFDVYKDDKKIINLNIDERGFNTISTNGGKSKDNDLRQLILDGFKSMKKSNPAYGSYDSDGRDRSKEGKLPLYTHDFMIYLKTNNILG
tara:strand:- start:1142 stop:3175 length:2034 start_codon:yes stop_codon:yes gene_type:complete